MTDESTTDPVTGLLDREAFLAEVRSSQNKVAANFKRGCLLILHFPVLKNIAEEGGQEVAADALQNLLAVMETRLRSRDTMGRIGQHSLCILLRQCLEDHAVIIAEQFAALLRDVVIDTGELRVPVDLHYRIVPLDARGSRSRQGVSKVIKARAITETSQLLSSLSTIPGVDTDASKVVPFKTGQFSATRPIELSGTSATVSAFPSRMGRSENVAGSQQAWRLKPGLILKNKPLVCCYRLQPLGQASAIEPLNRSALMLRVLSALALDTEYARPLIESQLIVPVDAAQLSSEAVLWLKNECRAYRVSPSDLCLLLHVDSLSKDLRVSLPLLRRLNRQGIKVMLEGVHSVTQYSALQSLAGFDYLLISARLLHEAVSNVRTRQELDALIENASSQHREVCAAGVDTPALMVFAQSLNIDIGFGRQCGKSQAFPSRPG